MSEMIERVARHVVAKTDGLVTFNAVGADGSEAAFSTPELAFAFIDEQCARARSITAMTLPRFGAT